MQQVLVMELKLWSGCLTPTPPQPPSPGVLYPLHAIPLSARRWPACCLVAPSHQITSAILTSPSIMHKNNCGLASAPAWKSSGGQYEPGARLETRAPEHGSAIPGVFLFSSKTGMWRIFTINFIIIIIKNFKQ